MKKIILTGAHGTGKTTVLELLKEKLSDYKTITEVARQFFKENNIDPKTCDDYTQAMIFDTYYDLLEQEGPWISDRGLIDVTAYSKAGASEGNVSEFIVIHQRKLFEKFIKDNPDILYVYFPIEFEQIEDDGIRPLEKEYQKKIDANIKETLESFGIKHIKVSGTPENRLNQIIESLK